MTITFWLIILAAGLVIYLAGGMFFLIGLFFPSKPRGTHQPMVSVIIAARNEEANIRRCLESVLNQSYPADRCEIIVVNDRSSDRTAEIAEACLCAHPQGKLISIENTPSGYSPKKWALQKGIERSQGEVLLFTDADCVVSYRWIEKMISYFDERTTMVTGFSAIEAGTWFERLQAMDFLALMTCAAGACNLGFPLSASGQNLAYRRSAFHAVNGFHPVMTRISGDDVLMLQLFRKQKTGKIVFSTDPDSFVKTLPAAHLKTLIHQRARWASNATIMLKLNPVFLIYLGGVYLFHLALATGWILALTDQSFLLLWVFALMNKFFLDLMVIINGSRLFRQPFSLVIFLLWYLTQTPYVLWVGLRGAMGKFRWK